MPNQTSELDPEFYELIGRIVTNWAVVDSMYNNFLAHILKADPGRTQAISQNVASATVSGWIRTLLNAIEAESPTLDDVIDMLNRIDAVRAERNALAHGVWSTDLDIPGVAMVQTVRWDRAEIIKDEVVSPPDLQDLLDEIIELSGEFWALGAKLGFFKRHS